jgi:hypothetical protein
LIVYYKPVIAIFLQRRTEERPMALFRKKLNRLLAETTGVSNTLYTYDANGNTLAAMKDGTLVYSYTYGLFDTQDSYTSDAVLYMYYTYRPDGLRHSIGDTIHIWIVLRNRIDGDVLLMQSQLNISTKDVQFFLAHP